MKIIKDLEQGSPEWFSIRSGKLTASEFGKILTPTGSLSKSAEAHMFDLIVECICPDEDPWPGNKHTDRGKRLEPEAREVFASLNPQFSVAEAGFIVGSNPAVGCSPDGLLFSSKNGEQPIAGLEIKCPSPKIHASTLISGEIPKKHNPQIHGGMVVTGLDEWHFMSYCPGLCPFITIVKRDDYTEKLEKEIGKFMENYKKKYSELIPILRRGIENV